MLLMIANLHIHTRLRQGTKILLCFSDSPTKIKNGREPCPEPGSSALLSVLRSFKWPYHNPLMLQNPPSSALEWLF